MKCDFPAAWREQIAKRHPTKGVCFRVPKGQSPDEAYSGRGWKIHLAVPKPELEAAANRLWNMGLYFKAEGDQGTYFDGRTQSGITAYLGTHKRLIKIADKVSEDLDDLLVPGLTAKTGDRVIPVGSGTDIAIRSNVMARFDASKMSFGPKSHETYAEDGLPTWTGYGGIPLLARTKKTAAGWEEMFREDPTGCRQAFIGNACPTLYQAALLAALNDFGGEHMFGMDSNRVWHAFNQYRSEDRFSEVRGFMPRR